ncbi:glycosyl hydrolase family 28-related protein [Atopococcus tabaci]|uniref:glycosyl hydrolase family 28-related protein n=1 Tax=Atopococcus tabaci TaxID=269774 RepID=UPI00146F9D26|nr:glycosyl hydrolase family 28-related protein [Atopococcus tabaci]
MKKLLFLLLAAGGLVFIVGAIVLGSPLTSQLDLGGSTPSESTYNVKEFGAAGDGRTDDTPAFEQAIEAAASNGGGEVFVPVGTYVLHPIFLQSHVDLIGADRDVVTLKLSDDADNQGLTRLVNIEEAENIQIHNITFDGNAPAHEGGTEHMHTLFIWDSKHIVVDNNRMQHAIGDGVSITGSTQASEDVTISNNILLDNHRSNIVVEQVNDIKIFRNQSTSNIGRPTLHFEPFEEMDLYGAEVYENTFGSNASDTYTIQIEGTPEPGNYFHDIWFYNNTIKGLSGRFMVKETKDSEIYNNTFTVKDLYIWFKNDNLHIYKNTIETRNGITVKTSADGRYAGLPKAG